ncbi:MAG TPA: ribosome silencing factor [Pyrinomonadaceae bacterium]|jgi:ribosome-associated protein
MKPNSSTPEPLTKKEQAQQKQASTPSTNATAEEAAHQPAELDERMLAALHAASDKKALDLIALDLRVVASFTDYFLIASGTNQRQVQAIADEVVERLKKQGTKALRIEGYNTAEWILVDYGDFIFHVFEEKARRFYDLERLWRDAGRVALPTELSSGDSSSSGGSSNGGSSRDERDGSLRTSD